jgi:hypothetical protein
VRFHFLRIEGEHILHANWPLQTVNGLQCHTAHANWPLQTANGLQCHTAHANWPYTYDLATTPVRTQAGGCLTTKKGGVVAGYSPVVVGFFCWPFSLFLTFCYFFTARKFWKLLFTVERGEVCYFLYLFFTVGNYDKLFFTGPGELLGFIVQGGNLKGCTYTYDLRTMLAVHGAGGCLTTKKGAWCGAVLARCGAFFVRLFHFLLFFLLLVNFINYFLLLKHG